MICDTLAASLVYNGKDWNREIPLDYYEKRNDKEYINPKIQDFLVTIYKQVSKEGIDKVVTSYNLKKIYKECVK